MRSGRTTDQIIMLGHIRARRSVMTRATGHQFRNYTGWRAASAAAGLVLAASALGQGVGDANAGHAVARTWCESCHVVDAAQKRATAAGAPTFAAVAAMPSTTAPSLHVFLMAPHPPMPDFQLSRQQVDDVTAYILSLKQK
jgi:mono/diheme cytochrome c family protein